MEIDIQHTMARSMRATRFHAGGKTRQRAYGRNGRRRGGARANGQSKAAVAQCYTRQQAAASTNVARKPGTGDGMRKEL